MVLATSAKLNQPAGIAWMVRVTSYNRRHDQQSRAQGRYERYHPCFRGTGTNNQQQAMAVLAVNATMVSTPTGPAVDAAGKVYISELGNNKIRKVEAATGVITTIAGTGTGSFTGDGRCGDPKRP